MIIDVLEFMTKLIIWPLRAVIYVALLYASVKFMLEFLMHVVTG